jgi:hypothetical protein
VHGPRSHLFTALKGGGAGAAAAASRGSFAKKHSQPRRSQSAGKARPSAVHAAVHAAPAKTKGKLKRKSGGAKM